MNPDLDLLYPPNVMNVMDPHLDPDVFLRFS